jgi:hypothetical protein
MRALCASGTGGTIRHIATSVAVAALLGAALCAFAQARASPFSTACPDCKQWESAVFVDEQELNRLETAVERLRPDGRSVAGIAWWT